MDREPRCRIICIGNRFIPGDDVGLKVYDRLKELPLPEGVELIEGGIAGLNLLRYADGVRRIIFVDAVSGFCADDEFVSLSREQLASEALSHFEHSAGIPYLVQAMPAALDGPLPELFLLGAEANASDNTIDSLANACLQAAMGDRDGKEGRTDQTA